MEMIIGREEGVEKPRLAIRMNGNVYYHGSPDSVPRNVSRRHCKITISDDSKITIEDITDDNFMFINGKDCKRKDNISLTDTIELGPSKYCLELDTILKGISTRQVYSISHLKDVLDSYQKEKMQLQVNQGKLNALSALPGVLSMISIGVAVFIPGARVVMIIIAAAFALFFAYIRYKKASEIPLKTKKMDEDFREKYVCPNPSCGHFLGMTPYKDLIKGHACPYCKCKYKE